MSGQPPPQLRSLIPSTTARIVILSVLVALILSFMVARQRTENQSQFRQLYDNFWVERTRTETAILTQDRKHIEAFLDSYTRWDDLVNQCAKPTPTWFIENFEDDIAHSVWDGVWLYGPKGNLLFRDTSVKHEQIADLKLDASWVWDHIRRRTIEHCFVKDNGTLYELFMASVHPSADTFRKTPIRGGVVAVRIWDSQRLAKLHALLEARFTLVDAREDAVATEEDRDQCLIVTCLPFSNERGEAISFLRGELPRPLLSSMQQSSRQMLLYDEVTAGVSLLVFCGLLIVWVHHPLRLIRRAIQFDEREPLLKLAQRNSDFGQISTALNRHFRQRDELESEVRERRKIESQLIEASAQAERASRAKSLFLATMSHEIRTPMNGVLGMADLLRSEDMPEKPRSYAVAIQSSAESLLRTLNAVLDLSRIDAGKMTIARDRFTPRAVFEDTCRLFAASAATKGIEIVSDVYPELPPNATGDTVRLRQIAMNLVGNAVKFTPAGQVVVTVRSTLVGGRLRINFQVADTGIGIPEDRIETIFDTFTQADADTATQYGGSGLGLSIARELCRLMGGDLSAKSEEGVGSVFSGYVFVEPHDYPGADLCSAGTQVALVLDETASRSALQRILESFSWTVFSETDDLGAEPQWIFAAARSLRLEQYEALREKYPSAKFVALRDLSKSGKAPWLADFELTKPFRWYEIARLVGVMIPLEGETVLMDASRTEALAGLRVLVAEDNPVNQVLTRTLLETWGCVVEMVETGAGAVAAAHRFQVILMDLKMPDLDGIRATQLIRQDPMLDEVQIIAVTANTSTEDREACIAAGMNGFLSKPFRPHELATALLGAVTRV